MAGGMEPNRPRDKPTPQPIKIAILSIRSENAPMVKRTAAPFTNTKATNDANKPETTVTEVDDDDAGPRDDRAQESPRQHKRKRRRR